MLLAGGGHAQLYSPERIQQPVDEGFDVVPVSPSRFLYYSRMSPRVLSRIYHPEETRIDVRYLVEKGVGRFIRGRFLHSKGMEVLLGSEVVKR